MKKKTTKKRKPAVKKPKKTTEAKKTKDETHHHILNEVAYEIKDKKYGVYEVRKTANAWWLSEVKISQFITAKKMGCNDTMSCCHAGITLQQLSYFLEIHPHFSKFFEGIKEEPKLIAMQTIYNDLSEKETAKWYLERRAKDEFSVRNELTGAEGQNLGEITDEQSTKIAKATLKAQKEKLKLMAALDKKGDK